MLKHSAAASGVATITSIQPPVQTGLYGYFDASIPASYPGTGTTWTDIAGGFVAADIRSQVSFVGDGNASYFDIPGGTSVYTDRSILSEGNNWSATNEVHVSAWVYKDAWGGEQQDHIFSLANGVTGVDLAFANYDERVLFALKAGGSFYNAEATGISSDDYLNQWVYLSYNYNGSALRGYRNGVQIAENTGASGNTDSYTDVDSGIGGQGWTLSGSIREMRNIFQGRIAVVHIHTASLSETEIQQNFNSMRVRFGV